MRSVRVRARTSARVACPASKKAAVAASSGVSTMIESPHAEAHLCDSGIADIRLSATPICRPRRKSACLACSVAPVCNKREPERRNSFTSRCMNCTSSSSETVSTCFVITSSSGGVNSSTIWVQDLIRRSSAATSELNPGNRAQPRKGIRMLGTGIRPCRPTPLS